MAGIILSMLIALGLTMPAPAARLSTWTLVGVDLNNGDVGVAGATCLPNQHADAVAALVPGKGAAAVQAFWDLGNRNNVYQLLQQGETAEEIIHRMTDRNY